DCCMRQCWRALCLALLPWFRRGDILCKLPSSTGVMCDLKLTEGEAWVSLLPPLLVYPTRAGCPDDVSLLRLPDLWRLLWPHLGWHHWEHGRASRAPGMAVAVLARGRRDCRCGHCRLLYPP